jgi:hypothetical protein
MLLGDRFRPITDTAGLFEASLPACASCYLAWMQPIVGAGGSRLDMTALPSGRLDEHLRCLEPLVRGGITRTLFVGTPTGWTACFTNGWRGTDMSSIVPMLSARLACDAMRVTCTPDLGKGPHRRFGARIIEMHHGKQTPARVISIANDGGKWVEHLDGVPLPQEATRWFGASRVRDHFTGLHLRELVSQLVPGFWDIDRWPAEGALLIERVGALPPTFRDVSLLEVQKDIPSEV